jgi:hypothetical protein
MHTRCQMHHLFNIPQRETPIGLRGNCANLKTAYARRRGDWMSRRRTDFSSGYWKPGT